MTLPAKAEHRHRAIAPASTLAMLIVLFATAYLVGDQRAASSSRLAHPASTAQSAAPVRRLSPGYTSCGRQLVSAEISGRPLFGLLACDGLVPVGKPRMLSVTVGQTISIVGLTLTRPTGLMSTDTPLLVSVDNAHGQLTALAAGRARLQLRSALCPQASGNPCTLAIIDIS